MAGALDSDPIGGDATNGAIDSIVPPTFTAGAPGTNVLEPTMNCEAESATMTELPTMPADGPSVAMMPPAGAAPEVTCPKELWMESNIASFASDPDADSDEMGGLLEATYVVPICVGVVLANKADINTVADSGLGISWGFAAELGSKAL